MFGILGLIFCPIVLIAIAQQQAANLLPLLIFPIFMSVGGYLVMKLILFDLVDEVWDCGDSILVKNKGREYQFALTDFMNLSYTGFMNPPRITLSLREPSDKLGTEIAFTPPYRMFPYSMPPIARDLMVRIDEARRQVAD